MSGDSFIVYFGLRFELSFDEIENVELRTDARISSARKAGLKYYFGNFGGQSEKYLLFVGEQIGIFGPEDIAELSVSMDDRVLSKERLRGMLDIAGFKGEPELHLIWHPDV